MYNAFELLLLIYLTFKRKAGLYFWSILLASFGLIPYCVGWLIVYFDLTKDVAGFVIDSVGWILVVSGQSVVLYSRLHLVLQSPRILRAVLWMIIIDGVVLHTTTTVVLFGSNLSDAKQGFSAAYKVIEKVQMTIFCIQEFIISGLYVWKTADILKTAFSERTRTLLWQLFGINVLIILMDVALLALEYKNLMVYQQGFKAVIYSVKLKLEFAVLNELVEVAKSNMNSGSRSTADQQPNFIDVAGSRGGSQSQGKTAKHRASFWSSKPEVKHVEDVNLPPEAPYTQNSPHILKPTFSALRAPAREIEDQSVVNTRADVERSVALDPTRSTISLDSEDVGSEQMYMRAMRQVSRPH
ncbi:hypothetical protein H2201_003241 [Coniosporium apollinis]|uniref:DUF7703 domain-containing protein n=1 Tax=Coniosporium apollinis TaxID=61459 RepID=A0ABQ9NWU3_9PEZI|nr:hypothetical protein H2201_003241 [Coniosporium apollinis]